MTKGKSEPGRVSGRGMVRDAGFILAGAVVFGIGMQAFIKPANIAPGGAAGIALLLSHITGFPVGALMLAVNIPLLILACFYLDRRFAAATAGVSLVTSVILDGVVAPVCPVYDGDRLLSSLYGRVLVGVGMALVFLTGATTGGTDIVGCILQKKKPHMSIGRALLLTDSVILALSVPVFGDMEAALLGLIALFAQTRVMDSILYGMNVSSMAAVVTKHSDAIAARIICELNRTATVVPARGAFSGGETEILICTVPKNQFGKLSRIVHDEDSQAFMMTAETSEVHGEGFKEF